MDEVALDWALLAARTEPQADTETAARALAAAHPEWTDLSLSVRVTVAVTLAWESYAAFDVWLQQRPPGEAHSLRCMHRCPGHDVPQPPSRLAARCYTIGVIIMNTNLLTPTGRETTGDEKARDRRRVRGQLRYLMANRTPAEQAEILVVYSRPLDGAGLLTPQGRHP